MYDDATEVKEDKEEKKVYSDPSKLWNDYENGKNYKSGENLYNIIRRNENYYAGDQWKGVKNTELPTPVFNFLEQLVDVKVSSVMANQITIHRRADELSEEDEVINLATKAFMDSDKKNWERVKMDAMNEEVLLDGAISGLGLTHWYWNEDLISGNTFLTKGDFEGETIDSINTYFSNPNDVKIQNQDWIIISLRKTLKQVKDMAKAYGKSESEIASIKGDEDTVYEGFDKAQNEQDGVKDASNQVTVLLKYWKNKDTNTIWFCKATKELVLIEEDTELERYPIALMQWKTRKRFIYGNAEITYIIANQQHVNKMEAMRQLHAQLMAIPKVGYNKNMINGFSNQVGGVLPIEANPGEDLSNAIHYFQPTQMTMDVDKSIESTISKTREFKGVNENVIGEGRADNTSAIIAQQRAAGVPLESVKRRFYQYLEDVALIWLDFYKHKYKLTRRLKDEEGNTISFTGTEYKDIDLKTSIDVGTSSQWSDVLSAQVLDTLLNSGHLNIVQFLERYPKNIIPMQDKLIEEKLAEMQAAVQMNNPNINPPNADIQNPNIDMGMMQGGALNQEQVI